MDIGLKRGGVLVIAWLALAPCVAAAADADFKFDRRPTGADFAAHYPSAALGKGHGGAALVRCRIAASGELEKCVVFAEAPEGEGFAAAALAISKAWRLSAASAAEHKGEVFETTIRFDINNSGYPPLLSLPGNAAVLVTKVDGAHRAHGEVFDCPTTSGQARRCVAHPIVWESRPKTDDFIAAVAGVDLMTGKTVVECAPGKAGALIGCRFSGDLTPKAQAAALDFAGRLKAPAKALDHTPVAGGKLIFALDWAAIQSLRERVAEADK